MSRQAPPVSQTFPAAKATGGERSVIAVGGVDPGGGAGVIRDFLVARARGAACRVVVTAWTEQSPRGVATVEARSPTAVRDGIARALAAAGGRTCVKVGMVATPGIVEAIVSALAGYDGPVVFDPVSAASSGGTLFAGRPGDLMSLVRRATLVTPNLAEARELTNLPVADLEGAALAGRMLLADDVRAVLIKGGHLEGDAVDVLVDDSGIELFAAPRIAGRSPRGTGCALATAIALELEQGRGLREAVATAKIWLGERIANAIDVGGERHLF